MTRRDVAICPLCEAACGLLVEHDGQRIHSIRGNPRDVMSRGYLCPKGVALMDVQHDRDRLREPLRRTPSGAYEPVSWDDALDDIGARLARIRREHGKDAVGFYYGNPTGHSTSAVMGMLGWRAFMGSKNVFSSQSVDALPRLYVSFLLYGNQATIPVPDIDRTDFLLMLGANPVVSNGSAMRTPDIKNRLQAVRDRGGRIVVIDPRRTETAQLADQHLSIRPGTDALLLASLISCVATSSPRPAPSRLLDGLGRVVEALGPFTPERVADRVGMDAPAIRALAVDLMRAKGAAIYGRMGTCVQEFGSVSSWLVDVLAAITGNLDRPGGSMFATPALDLAAFARRLGQRGSHDAHRSRVSGQPETNGELPVTALAEEIETPGHGQIRAMVLHAGNPVLSLPNGPRIERALSGLELLVAIDIYRNETTGLAHYILPPTFGLEHDIFPALSQGLSIRNVAQYAPALLEAPPGCRHDYAIFGDLVRAVARHERSAAGALASVAARGLAWIEPHRVIDGLLRAGPHSVSLAKLREHPDGLDLGPLEPRLHQVVAHRSGRVDLAPAPLMADLARLAASLSVEAAAGSLVLISRRSLRSNNSWMHNAPKLITGQRRCTLEMHPDDARARGLGDGARARVTSRVGAIEAEVEVTDRVRPGVVCLPHGWGHDRAAAALSVASTVPGVSVNDVVDDARVDALTRTSALSGTPVEVAAL